MDEHDDTPFNFADEDVIPEPPEMDDDLSPSDDPEDEDSYDEYPEDDMDGDAESALASCGWGTDEDYGYFGGDEF